MSNTLKLVLTDHWFEEIKSGRKIHEYRKYNSFWEKRVLNIVKNCANYDREIRKFELFAPAYVEFQKAYRKNPEKMLFEIKSISFIKGKDTDLKCDCPVFDIELGERMK